MQLGSYQISAQASKLLNVGWNIEGILVTFMFHVADGAEQNGTLETGNVSNLIYKNLGFSQTLGFNIFCCCDSNTLTNYNLVMQICNHKILIRSPGMCRRCQKNSGFVSRNVAGSQFFLNPLPSLWKPLSHLHLWNQFTAEQHNTGVHVKMYQCLQQ